MLGLFFVAMTVVSTMRFLLLARRTRQAPELHLGLMSLCLGGSVVVGLIEDVPRVASGVLSGAGAILNLAFVVSVLRVPAVRLAAYAVGSLCALSVAASIGWGEVPGSATSVGRQAACALSFLLAATGFASHAALARKKLAIGLASALELVGFRLLSAAELSLGLAFVVRALGEVGDARAEEILLLQLPLAVLGALCSWLALAPPGWLKNRLEHSAQSEPV